MLTHLFDGDVLIVRLPDDLDVSTRGTVVSQFEFLLRSYRPRTVVMELPWCAGGAAVVSAVLRAERLCRAAGASFGTTTSRAAPSLIDGPSPTEGLSLADGPSLAEEDDTPAAA
ncbi:hypothetical protein [Streptomyces sp. NPDC058623]|uniref:hypothetical protein n=1 Tax=Streptomyces sp. NPDC058623 TaxID=3346563 RepID=UPI003654E1E7